MDYIELVYARFGYIEFEVGVCTVFNRFWDEPLAVFEYQSFKILAVGCFKADRLVGWGGHRFFAKADKAFAVSCEVATASGFDANENIAFFGEAVLKQ